MTTWRVPARVVRVIDGDTLVCDFDLGWDTWIMGQRVRLLGVDTPEMTGATKQAGEAARQFTCAAVQSGSVIVTSEKLDSFGRVLGRVTLPDGRDLSALLLAAGHAVPM